MVLVISGIRPHEEVLYVIPGNDDDSLIYNPRNSQSRTAEQIIAAIHERPFCISEQT